MSVPSPRSARALKELSQNEPQESKPDRGDAKRLGRAAAPSSTKKAPAAKKEPTPLTDEELDALYGVILDSDTSKATARVIQRMAEARLGLERDTLKPKKDEIRRFMQELMFRLEAPDDLMGQAQAKWILMQFKSGVTEDNLTTLEELQTSDSRTCVKILAEVLDEFGNEEDAAYYAKLAPRAPLAPASLRAKTKLVCYKEDSDDDDAIVCVEIKFTTRSS